MDYRIRRRKSELESTGYVEICPGKYCGKHWQDGCLFIWEDAFGMAEGIILKHFHAYDHFSMNDIPEEVGRVMIEEWKRVAAQLNEMSPEQAHSVLNLQVVYREFLKEEVHSHKSEIASMLHELAEACEEFYEQGKWICILGM